ncbi:MAG: hypothetical protein BWY63_03695 [Chloroflexi bacterium ADurb.Bin360]|nr:MAG: hypothetical protein BWY63_03695 [Chloroflexi bacterium ADurb.Bin360]
MIETVSGIDSATGKWVCPLRDALGLKPRESVTTSPELIERVCFMATQARSYEAAEEIAKVWGCDISDSSIHRHVVEFGSRIDQQRAEQAERAIDHRTKLQVVGEAARRVGQEKFSLVIMLDGWMIRERGADWGLKPAEAPGSRVAWREMKSGIVFRAQDVARTQSGRGIVLEKHYESYREDVEEFGRRLYALALRCGLHQAQRVFVVADGALWIWSLSENHFKGAFEQIDFYHASQHLWEVANALHADPKQARAWIEPLLHQLRHGGEAGFLDSVEGFLRLANDLDADKQAIIESNVQYFTKNKKRLHYARNSRRGCPVGSGAMESTCAQFQDRFKRTGQFWKISGEQALMSLELIRRNSEWADCWSQIW